MYLAKLKYPQFHSHSALAAKLRRTFMSVTRMLTKWGDLGYAAGVAFSIDELRLIAQLSAECPSLPMRTQSELVACNERSLGMLACCIGRLAVEQHQSDYLRQRTAVIEESYFHGIMPTYRAFWRLGAPSFRRTSALWSQPETRLDQPPAPCLIGLATAVCVFSKDRCPLRVLYKAWALA